jgi:hypothetical protein
MKKITAICFIACALTTNNNIFGMLKGIIRSPQQHPNCLKRKYQTTVLNIFLGKVPSNAALKNILKDNQLLILRVREHNAIVKKLIAIQETIALDQNCVDEGIASQKIIHEAFQLTRRFRDLNEDIKNQSRP